MNTHLFQQLRTDASEIFQAGIDAANPYAAVKRAINLVANQLEFALDFADSSKVRSGNWTKIHLIAFGKAACAMAKAAQEIIPAQSLSAESIVVTNYENKVALDNLTVIGAGHPLPDEAGLDAAKQVMELAKNAQQGELVLVLISGGGSALLPAPTPPISLTEKMATTNLLLGCGATIQEINCVRKHLSQLKGGHLARLAYPADLHALILSDVVGDDLSSIASGTTVADESSYGDAIEILKAYQIWNAVAESVQQTLENGQIGVLRETPKPGNTIFKNTSYVLVGSNTISLNAAMSFAESKGYQAQLYNQALIGEAREEADNFALHVKNLLKKKLKNPVAILAGGETTVTLTGNGHGGRNQEMALAFAIAAKKYSLPAYWTFLSGGTDGLDGPTEAAGGLVDAESMERMRGAGLNPTNRLNNHDSYTALKSSEDLLITGATGTNVADLQVLLLKPL